MHPTAGQLSGRNSAGSSRFAKSVASTIATSDGPPDPAEPVRDDQSRPSVRLLATPPTNARHRSVVARRTCWPAYRSLACRESIGRPSTEWDDVLAKDTTRLGFTLDLTSCEFGHNHPGQQVVGLVVERASGYGTERR